ncbi:MAG: hypothetical protein Q8P29_01385 [Candidatus Levybacteria bacterium]|nr:hypothetical protein [Candidatus Levybacteria bacterium]MDZ4227643.1 hypothetical protein [Candidatus Levybacteria bacterium]
MNSPNLPPGSVAESQNPALSRLSNLLIASFEREEIKNQTKTGINVNRFVSELATWYEKFRNAMDYRDEEVVRRAAIERILKRRFLFGGGNGEKIAPPLMRELLWARYFPDASISDDEIKRVGNVIDLYLELRKQLQARQREVKIKIDSLIYQLLSSHLEIMLNKSKDIELISNFIFHLLRERIVVKDDSEETRDIQVFIAVRRAFAKDDIAFLRFHLFEQYFGRLTEGNIHTVAVNFAKGYGELERQIRYPLKERIISFVKKQLPPFLIFAEVLRKERGGIRTLIDNAVKFQDEIFASAQSRYKTISSKVRTAIIRSVIFILLTKFIFAFSVEATYDNIVLGHIEWNSLIINIFAPPFLMVIVSLFIRTPDRNNTKRIYDKIMSILFIDKPELDRPLILNLKPDKKHPILNFIFSLLWWGAFVLIFGYMDHILGILKFSPASRGIFIFFIAIISFLTYRITQTASSYTIPARQNFLAPVTDFFFMPIIKVGRRFTEGIAQINIFIYIFDYLIETPFKEIFGFLEKWFYFLQTKREEMG